MAQAATGSWARRTALGTAGGSGPVAGPAEGGTWTDRSTGLVANTDKEIVAAATASRRVRLENPSQEQDSIFWKFGGAATIVVPATSGDSFEIRPGQSWEGVTKQSIHAISASTRRIVAAEVTG